MFPYLVIVLPMALILLLVHFRQREADYRRTHDRNYINNTAV